MNIRTSANRPARGRTVLSRGVTVLISSIFIAVTAAAAAAAQCCAVPPPELVGPAAVAVPSDLSAGIPALRVSNTPVVLNFTVPTISGGEFSLQAVRGTPVVLYFMAFWCPTCVPEARALGELKSRYGNRISIVALDVDPRSTPALLERFRRYVGNPPYTFAFDVGDRIARELGVRNLETNVFIDSTGMIVSRSNHSLGYADLVRETEKLLQ